MAITQLFLPGSPDDEARLAEYGLSSADFHDAFRPGLSRAVDRTELAPANAAGTDLYNDSFEFLAQILVTRGWRKVVTMGQPRLVHPDGLIQLALSSAIDVADPDHRVKPKTRRKGPATQRSLDNEAPKGLQPLPLPEWVINDTLPPKLNGAPLWLALYERQGNSLNLALGRPAEMNASGHVVAWSDAISIARLDGDDDFSVFNSTDDGGFDVPVEPR
jgi:hypothetical protein